MLPGCDGMQIWELELDVESKDANNKQVSPVPARGAEGLRCLGHEGITA